MIPSGRQIEIHHGAWAATVVEVGGGLRALTHAGVPVIDGYGQGEMASGGRGQPLLPWPNRLAEGRYAFAGRGIRAPITDPGSGTAIHGLTRWLPWRLEAASTDACTMALRLHPQPAYPFLLDLRLGYALSGDGLTVAFTAVNAGPGPLPLGAGFHPYLTAGTATIDAARLTVPAATWLPADARGIPTGARRGVAEELDLRRGEPLGARRLDHCLTDLARDPDGLARVHLDGPARRVTLWMDRAFGYVMVFTGDTLAPARRRRGLAVEPMTCPPNALRSGESLLVLEPGASAGGRFGIAVAPAAA